MKLTKLSDNILHFKAKNQRVLTSSFVRMQEFYESPMEGFCGTYFTLKEFKKAYAQQFGEGEFTYYTDWCGFNIPSNAIKGFWDCFRGRMTWVERRMKRQILSQLPMFGLGTPFYIIGTHNDDTIDHELAHAMWYLDQEYKHSAFRIMNKLLGKWTMQACDHLMDGGYSPEVLSDEIHAYLSTSTIADAMDNLGSEIDLPYDIMKDLQLHFCEYKGKLNA